MILYLNIIGKRHYHRRSMNEDLAPYNILLNTTDSLYYTLAFRNSEVI